MGAMKKLHSELCASGMALSGFAPSERASWKRLLDDKAVGKRNQTHRPMDKFFDEDDEPKLTEPRTE